MVAVPIDLGSIKVTGKKHNLSLTLSSSFTIMLPPSWSTSYTADELRKAFLAGELWVSKPGSCRIEFLTLLNSGLCGGASLDPSVIAAIISLASECPVWKDLGLELRVNYASHDRLDQCRPQVSYFLHHPDLASEMIAPRDVRLAQFQSLTCEVDYCFGISPAGAHASPQPTFEPPSSSQHAPEDRRQSTYGFRSNPQLSKKAAAPHEGTNSPLHFEQESTEAFAPEAVIAEMACLLDAALRKLIGDKRTSPKGRAIKNTQPHSLIDIAPAVWNLRYLQTMTAHAQIIPTIATGLARLKNAQSASLREKLDIITHAITESNNKETEFNPEASSTADEIKKRLWLLCQTGIQPEPVRRQSAGKQPGGHAAKQSSQRDVVGPEVDHRPPVEHGDGFHSNILMEGDNQVIVGHDPYADCQQELCDSEFLGVYGCLRADEPYGVEDSEQSTADYTDSSEADYFYADGQGNVYRIGRPDVPDPEAFSCPQDPPFPESHGLSDEGRQEMVVYGDADANETYIMYHEVQH
ncbi:hypothetical protein MFIFM68171_03463 [Madurella fahalii]|uniref:Uncharacterized protein n=1 Tax=Madurella fahalii TaxID=1157608 RepID=A0ABQ0G665_9PEZI